MVTVKMMVMMVIDDDGTGFTGVDDDNGDWD